MSKIGKVVSFEKDSNILSPMTDAQYVQYNNSDITVKIKNTLDNNFREVPCVNVKEGLDALSKMTLPMVVEFSTSESTAKIYVNDNEYIRNNACDIDCDNAPIENLNCEGTYTAWSKGDTNDFTQCIYTNETPHTGSSIYKIGEISPGSESYEMAEIGFIDSFAPSVEQDVATKTYAQIKSAIDSGKPVIGKCEGTLGDQLFLKDYSLETNAIYISGIDIHNLSIVGFWINSDDEIAKYEGEIIELPEPDLGCNINYLLNPANLISYNGEYYLDTNVSDILTKISDEINKEQPKFYSEESDSLGSRWHLDINQYKYNASDGSGSFSLPIFEFMWTDLDTSGSSYTVFYHKMKIYASEYVEIDGVSRRLNKVEHRIIPKE